MPTSSLPMCYALTMRDVKGMKRHRRIYNSTRYALTMRDVKGHILGLQGQIIIVMP